LDKLRAHRLPVTSARIDAILGGIDVLNSMLRQLDQEELPGCGTAQLSHSIRLLAGTEPECAAPLAGMACALANADAIPDAAECNSTVPADTSLDRPASIATEQPALKGSTAPTPVTHPLSGVTALDGIAENSLRIDANRLDAVMNQVGELVLLRNRLS